MYGGGNVLGTECFFFFYLSANIKSGLLKKQEGNYRIIAGSVD